MGCPNRSSKEFKFLAERNNVSIETLELITKGYWENAGTEDYFPTDVYINAKLGKGKYQESSKAVRDLWNRDYSKPIEYSSQTEFNAAYEEAKKYFPESAISYHKNFNDAFVLVVKEPVENLNSSIKDYLDKDTYTNQECFDYSLISGKKNISNHRTSGPQRFTFNDGVSVDAPFAPNFQQTDALNAISNFLKSNETTMTLSGYAGTGKTSLMEMIAQKAKKEHRPIIFCATTNKAAYELNERTKKSGFKAQTLNKVFGISVEVDPNEAYDTKKLKNVEKDVNLTSGTTVIIDEASMINEANYNILNRIAKEKDLKIIYVGDEAQLAPVKEDKISKVFRNNDGNIRRLTIVERTGDNAILKEATNLRSNQPLSGESSFNKEGRGVAYIKTSNTAAKEKVIEHFVPGLKSDPNSFRILAFHNKVVTSYNDTVRRLLGYNTPIPQVGEPMVGYSNWGYLYKNTEKPYRFINSEAYKVTKVEKPIAKSISINGETITMEATPITLEDSMGNKDTFDFIDIRSNQANREAAFKLAKEKDRLWGEARKLPRDLRSATLRRINEIESFLFVNDNITIKDDKTKKERTLQDKVIDYGYAMTVHKSQGSTFKNVLVDDADISSARNQEEFLSSVGLFDMPNFDTAILGNTEDVGLDFVFEGAAPATQTTDNKAANIKQQLRYVAVSRATDTVTVIANDANVKKEDTPLNHANVAVSNASSVASQPTVIENTPKSADQMNRRELWEHLESLTEPMGERPISYTPVGKTRQEYIVKDGKVYNKKGEEVHYQGKDMNRILANLAVTEDRGVVVTYRDADYVVDNHQTITSVKSGDIMKWGPQDGNRKAIIQLAEQKFKTLIENRQNRLSEMVPELMDLLKAQGINVNDKAAMEKFLKENPQWSTKIQQAIEENREMQDIKAKAIADSTFMKAPNGKDTNLTERQWLQVRTKNFINWFGDWLHQNPQKVLISNRETVNKDQNWVDDSKVIEEDGRYYYTNELGTKKEITKQEFDDFNNGKDIVLSEKTYTEKKYDHSKVLDENGEPLVMYHITTTKGITTFDRAKSKHAGFWFSNDPNYYVKDAENNIHVDVVPAFLNIREPNEIGHGTFLNAVDGDVQSETLDNTRFDGWITRYIHNPEFYEDTYSESAPIFAMATSPNQIKSATDNNGMFSTENDDIQMMIRPYSKKHPYRNKVKATEQQRAEILGFIKSKEYNNDGTDIVTLRGDDHQYVYVVDHSSHALLEENQKENEREGITTDLFGIRRKFNIKKLTENDIRYIARNIASDYGGSETSIQHRMQELGITTEQLPGIDIDAAIQKGIGDYGKMVTETGEVGEQTVYDRSSIDSGENQTILPEGQRLETSEGDIYGFADQKGDLYFDEEKISPNVQIHEYTHLWDRAVAQRNPKLWKRGVDLMKQTSLWNEVLNDSNYGQKWKAMKGMTPEKMESLIASEVHSRLTGTQGEALLNRIAKEKGSKGIVAKLKQWMLDFWKELKGTFSNWSDEEINSLTLDDFNKMTVRDLVDKVNLKEQQSTQQQVVGENISSRGSAFAKRLTNPFNNETIEFRGTKFDNAEHAYQTWKSGKFDQRGYDAHGGKVRGTTDYSSNYQTMVEILTAKLQQHPDLVGGIAERGGEAYLKASTHDVVGDKYWETKTGQNKFIEALTEAYNSVTSQQAVMPEEESSGITVQLPGYEHFNDLYEDTTVDAEWKVPMLQELDTQLSTENTKEQNDAILAQMDKILDATSEEDLQGPLSKKQAEVVDTKLSTMDRINQQINNLYEINGLNVSEVQEIAEDVMNDISDAVTRMQKEPDIAKKWFPTLETNLDFATATRKQIFDAVGLDRLINAAKKRFNTEENDYSPEMEIQADAIYDNFDAILSLGKTVFAMNEGFGIKMDYRQGSYGFAEGMHLDSDDFNNYQDTETIEEKEGDEQEHWQIEQRTLDVLNTATEAVRMAIHDCYQIGVDGRPVMNKWGIKKRVNPRNAVNSILTWTQGALTLPDMITQLSAKQEQHKWLESLINRLRNNDGSETDLQSQFFNVMCKPFQHYSIVLLDNGKYAAVPVNDNPSLTDIMQSLSAQFKIKQHPLFMDEGKERINSKYLKELHETFNELYGIAENLKRDATLTSEMAEQAEAALMDACGILGYVPSKEIMDVVVNKDNIIWMTKYLDYIVKSLDKAIEQQKADTDNPKAVPYDPFAFKGSNSIGGTLRNFLEPITTIIDEIVPNVVYDDGKLYQAYVTPSYMTLLMEKFHWDEQKVQKFLQEEYGKSQWFKTKEHGWRGEWLRELATSPEARKLLAHTVELNFNKRRYMRNMSDAEYTISIITHYFAESAKDNETKVPAWFRVPMQSNKPSSEFIKFYSWRDPATYKTHIVQGLYEMFLQELDRIDTVNKRNRSKGDYDFIKNFDSNGKRFNYLPFLNEYLTNKEGGKILSAEDNSKLAKVLQKKIKAEEDLTDQEEADLMSLTQKAITKYMEERASSILNSWEEKGILDAAKNIKGIGSDKETIKTNVENFLWNDYYASKNILQLTIGDVAAYKDAEDLQKRLAQLHAPGIRANIYATDYNGQRVSDGVYRTLVLKDFDTFISNIIDNLSEVFDRKIARAPERQRAALKIWKESLVGKNGKFRKINVADAQGYSSPSSYRKKALMFGRWSRKAEEVYNKLEEGNYTETDLETVFQPLKPFVYAQLHKDMGVEKARIKNMPIPFQAKNAEYLLVMADALIKGEEAVGGKLGRPNLLRAVYRIMEDSELLNPTKGIDTVQFESAIKSGLQGAVDINQFLSTPGGEDAAYAYIQNLIYQKDADGKLTKDYNTQTFIHETSYSSYCLQQEVPAHFKNHNQSQGSQERMIIPSDLARYVDPNGNRGAEDNQVYYEWTDPDGTKRRVKADEFRREYEDTIADSIDRSISELRDELRLDSRSLKERNLALSEILQREILDSSRYGIDMFLACGINPETGEFRVPKGDPIQAKRIEQLINSIIKNRINKQEIAGGPIVQVSNFGTSEQLHIRFHDKKGGIMPLKEEYEAQQHDISYEQYVKENQAGMAYYEVYAPIWAKEIFEKFTDKNGNIDVGAIEMLDPDLLKMISYRIPTEDKYSIAPMKVMGFMPREAGDALMLPYELTEIDDSDFDVDKRYVMRWDIQIATRVEPKENESMSDAEKSYIEHNKKSIVDHLIKTINLQGKTTAAEREAIEKDANSEAEYKKRTADRVHQERLATIEKRNEMAEEALDNATFSKNEEKNSEIWDKKSDKLEESYNKALEKEEKRYQTALDKIESERQDAISKGITKLENRKVRDRINQFLTVDRFNNSSQDDALTRDIRRAYIQYMYHTVRDTKGKTANNNKVLDMTWAVLTNEYMADQLLNPGGFDGPKKAGYKIAAYKNPANSDKSWDGLDAMSIDGLKDLYYTDKDLCWADTQVQFYKQNSAAASLIGVFAVNKVAHAVLEGNGIEIDINDFCGEQGFTIAGKVFNGRMLIDQTYDDEGNLIGKTLGSLVSASADAVKDPILNLMNINMTTAGMLNTMLRLGMSFDDAALFLSQNIISDVMDEFNKENLSGYESLENIIQKRLAKIKEDGEFEDDSTINTEELTREELISQLRGNNEATDYKILLAFQKIKNLANAMRKPTFATRFNSVSSAVGPLIIDNLILEHKMEQFRASDDTGTGFYKSDGTPVDITTIFDEHPVLRAFAESVDIAKGLFRDMPAGSTGFRNLLDKLPEGIKDKVFNDKSLLNDLSNFYQSYLLIQSGMIDGNDLKYYIEEYPKVFFGKEAALKEKYPDNALIQAIKPISSKKTGRTFLQIDITGEDETKKDTYRSAWIDLHKKDPKLSTELFTYFFFRAGIGFSPKTGMGLVPTFVKERLSSNGISYLDVYRKLISGNPEIIIDQFIRNNWNESKLVPKTEGIMSEDKQQLIVNKKEALIDLQGTTYARTYQNGQTYLWKLIGKEEDKENQKRRVYRRIKPLGDNNEYLEMNIDNTINPISETTLDIEDTETSELQKQSPSEMEAEDMNKNDNTSDVGKTKAIAKFVDGIMLQWDAVGKVAPRSEAEKKFSEMKLNPEKMGNFIVNVYDKIGMQLSKEDAIKEFKKLC